MQNNQYNRNWEGMENLISLIRFRPRSIDELGKRLGVSERTVYRWILFLSEEMGEEILRLRIGGEYKYEVRDEV